MPLVKSGVFICVHMCSHVFIFLIILYNPTFDGLSEDQLKSPGFIFRIILESTLECVNEEHPPNPIGETKTPKSHWFILVHGKTNPTVAYNQRRKIMFSPTSFDGELSSMATSGTSIGLSQQNMAKHMVLMYLHFAERIYTWINLGSPTYPTFILGSWNSHFHGRDLIINGNFRILKYLKSGHKLT